MEHLFRHEAPTLLTGHLEIPPALAEYAEALVWARIGPASQACVTPLMPHGGMLLVVSMASLGRDTAPCGARPVTSLVARRLSDPGATLRTRPSGCDSVFALLKPRGALCMMRRMRLGDSALDRLNLQALVGREEELRLVTAVERESVQHGPDFALRAMAGWLEHMCLDGGPFGQPGGLAALLSEMVADPTVDLNDLRDAVGVGRRNLERHLQAWFGTTPRQLQRVVRVQHAARLAWQRWRAAEIAFELGFADQSHFSRTVNRLTGMTARRFMTGMETALSSAFRNATAGGNLMPAALHAEPMAVPEAAAAAA